MLTIIAAQALAAAASPDLAPRSLQHQGRTRSWSEHVPAACVRPATPCLTVLMLHGGSPPELRQRMAQRSGRERTPELVATATGMVDAARRDGFILIVPKAADGNWADGREGVAAGIDDVGFLRAVLADVGKRAAISPERTFSAGVSNGGMMSFRLACEASDRIRGVGAVVANMSVDLAAACPKGRPVDIVQVLGAADPLMKYDGGRIPSQGGNGTTSAADTLRLWSARLDAPTAAERKLNEEVTLRTVTARNGRIAQYTLASYGHGWPSGSEGELAGAGGFAGRMMQRLRGTNPTRFDATRVLIDFFKATPPRR